MENSVRKIPRWTIIAGGLLLAFLATAVIAAQNVQGVFFPGNGTFRLPWANTGNGTQANHTTVYAAGDGSVHVKAHGGTDINLSTGAGGGGDLTEIQETGDGITVTNGTGPIPSLALQARLQEIAALTSWVKGDVLVWNGEKLTILPRGTDGQVLTTEDSASELGLAWSSTAGGTVDGGGTGAHLAVWSDANTLTSLGGPTDNAVPIGNGSAFVLESGATLRTSLGLTIGTHVQAWDEELDDVAGVSPTADQFLGGTGSALAMRTAAQVRSSLGLAASGDGSGDLTAVTETGDAIVISGGTGPTPDFSVHAKVEAIADLTVTDNLVMATNGTVPVTQTLTSLIDEAIGSTRGAVLERGASGWTALAPGTVDLPLVSNGSGADPAYEVLALAGGGTGSTTSSDARTALGVAIGVNVQAFDSDLTELAAITGSRGDIIFHNGTDWVRLAPSTDGFVLSTEGSDEDPVWISPGGGGDLTEVTETGDGIIVSNGTGPVVDLSVQARLEDIASITTWATNHILMAAGETSLINVAPATARTNLGLAIGSDVQAFDEELSDIAGLTPTDNGVVIGNGSSFVVESGTTLRTSIGLAIGTDVQAWDEELDDVAAVSPTADQFLGGTGSALAMRTASQVRTSLALVVGTNVQAFDADLSALAGISGVRGDIIFYGASGWTRLAAAGTDGFVLSSEGDDEDPAWIEPPAGTITEVTETGDGITITGGTGPTVDLELDAELQNVAGVTPSANQFLGGDGSDLVMRTAAQVRTSLNVGDGADLTEVQETGNGVIVASGTGPIPSLSVAELLEDIASITSADADQFLGFTGTTAILNRTPAQVRTSLALVVGTNVQAFDDELADVAGLTPGDGEFIVGDGSAFVTESGATARASLGLTIGTHVQAFDADLTALAAISGVRGDIIFYGASGWTRLAAAGTDGFVLSSEGDDEDPAWIAQSAGSGDLTEITETGVGISIANGTGPVPDLSLQANLEDIANVTPTRGDLLVVNSTGDVVDLAVGAAGTVFIGGTDPSYSATPTVTSITVGTGSATAVAMGTSANHGYFAVDDTSHSWSIAGTHEVQFNATMVDLGTQALMWGSAVGTNQMSLRRNADRVFEFGDETLAANAGADVTIQSAGLADLTIAGGAGTTGTAGGTFTARGGAGGSSGDAGTASLIGGISGSSAGETGGLAIVQGGAAQSTDNNGGGVQILGADGGSDATPRSGGAILIDAGEGGTGAAGAGGNITIAAGGASSTGDGGTVTISAGNSASGADGPILMAVAGATALEVTSGGFTRSYNGVVVGTLDANGWRLIDSGTSFQFLDGDGTDLDVNDSVDLGTTSGFPRVYAANYAVQVPYSYVGDTNTGQGCLEADVPGTMSEGRYKHFISNKVALTDASAVNFVTIPLVADNSMAVNCRWAIHHGSDAVDNYAVKSGEFIVLAQDDSGTLTSSITESAMEANLPGAGGYTMTETFSIVDGTNAITIRVSADTSAPSTTANRFFIEFECWVSTSDTTNSIPTIP